MPSQDDFLDELLKDIDLQDDELTDMTGLDEMNIESFLGVEDTKTMSEDDIEKVLTDKQETAERDERSQQSQNNEAIDDDIMALLQDVSDEVDILDQAALEAEEENTGELTVDSTPVVKKTKDERNAEKAAAREAKKAAKVAKKQAKKDKKSDMLKKGAMDGEPVQVASQEDLSDLDALLSMAGNTIQSTGTNAVPEADKDSLVAGIVEEKKTQKKAEKKSVFARFVDFLMEEEEEEEPEKGNENIPLSEENKTVIEELDKKKKKKKGKNDKKSKKGDIKEAASEVEEAEEGETEGKEKKPKKEKKQKKEKPLTDEIFEQERTKGSKISMKKVMPIALVCLSVGIIIVLVAGMSGDYSAKKAGTKAYYEQDYETCYQNLYGKELNESEQVMYSKSESILRIRLWIREYEMFAEEGEEAEALDSLIQSVSDYPALYEYAIQWNAGPDVVLLYDDILEILSEKYNLTEVQALEIDAVKDDAEYSKRVYAIADGESFGFWELTEEEIEAGNLEDILPEEEELGDVSFVDSNN